ncbi:MAG TPA: hypothetical protein VKB40_01330 [Candidatus Acidoferrales bacterium]|nr:hypothetical protein [Candidatus Acidoferrales bacterium]
MKASKIFDSCHGRYRNLREWLAESTEQIRALDPESNYDCYHWRPAQVRAAEFVPDYERIGRKALGRPEWKGRLKLFEIYFVHSVEYKRAISLVGVGESTFEYWLNEVKRALGRECARAFVSAVAQFRRVGVAETFRDACIGGVFELGFGGTGFSLSSCVQ